MPARKRGKAVMADNYGAKNHLRPILLGMKPKGVTASQIIDVVVVIVSRETERKGGRDVPVGD